MKDEYVEIVDPPHLQKKSFKDGINIYFVKTVHAGITFHFVKRKSVVPV